MNKEIKAKALEGFEKWFTDEFEITSSTNRNDWEIEDRLTQWGYLSGYQQAFEDAEKTFAQMRIAYNNRRDKHDKLQKENKMLDDGEAAKSLLIAELKEELHRVVNKHTELSSQIEVFDKHAKSMASQASKHMRENEKLKSCVEFYADRENWSNLHGNPHSIIVGSDVENYGISGCVFRGGNKARQTLKEIEGEK